jgi:hypothetical protein
MNTRTRTLVVVIVLVALALLIYAFTGRATMGAPRTLNLSEYGVALDVPGSLSDLTYSANDESENGPGTVLHMFTKSGCNLAAIYQIKKNAIAESHTSWSEQTLEQFQMASGDKPAQVKEFTDFYLVFEPNPTLCATDEKGKAAESLQQLDLWNSLATAHYMQY